MTRISRVARYKLGYVVLIGTLSVLALIVINVTGSRPWVVAVVILSLLIPGRLQGLLFRDFFRGRGALDRGDGSSALTHLQTFLATIHSQPWRKPALWLSWSFYTPSVEAMTHNNIGSAHFCLKDFDAAANSWTVALEIDPQYPIPHANLALIAAARSDSSVARLHLDRAKELGYAGDGFDKFAYRVQSALAAVESHGPKA